MQRLVVRLFAAIAALMFVAGGVAHAGTTTFKGSDSGTTVNVPVDPDSDSCSPAANGATVCTDTSVYANVAGWKSPGGGFSGQAVVEIDPVSGAGCKIGSTMVPIASCPLAGGSEQGCEFQSVADTEVDRNTFTGDLLFFSKSDTICFDLSGGPPFNLTATTQGTITGGTGKNAGATGTITSTFHGQQLTLDAAGHGLGWGETDFTGTITTP